MSGNCVCGGDDVGSGISAAVAAEFGALLVLLCKRGNDSKIVRGLRSTGAVGIDDIHVGVLKTGIDVLAAPLPHLCNVSLATGVVPSGFKAGKILPGNKGGTSPG
jgi:hypothetical protein